MQITEKAIEGSIEETILHLSVKKDMQKMQILLSLMQKFGGEICQKPYFIDKNGNCFTLLHFPPENSIFFAYRSDFSERGESQLSFGISGVPKNATFCIFHATYKFV